MQCLCCFAGSTGGKAPPSEIRNPLLASVCWFRGDFFQPQARRYQTEKKNVCSNSFSVCKLDSVRKVLCFPTLPFLCCKGLHIRSAKHFFSSCQSNGAFRKLLLLLRKIRSSLLDSCFLIGNQCIHVPVILCCDGRICREGSNCLFFCEQP